MELAAFINGNHPEIKGLDRVGLYRMKQFYETYESAAIVSPLVRQLQSDDNKEIAIVSPPVTKLKDNKKPIPLVETVSGNVDIRKSLLVQISWTAHLIIFSRCKTEEEKGFYIRLTISENYSKRELDRQISAGLFERVMIGSTQLSPTLKATHPNILNILKTVTFLNF